MSTKNAQLMTMARESLRGKWGLAIGTCFIYGLVISVSGVAFIAPLIIGGPMMLGLAMFSLSLSRTNDPDLEILFKGFKNFGTALGAYLLMLLFVFLWSLLLIIPGIIASIAYSMTFFILADEPELGASDALAKSKRMMRGYKWKYFCLNLRFIGWAILCVISLGIGFLWLIPYMQISYAKFYEDVKTEYQVTLEK